MILRKRNPVLACVAMAALGSFPLAAYPVAAAENALSEHIAMKAGRLAWKPLNEPGSGGAMTGMRISPVQGVRSRRVRSKRNVHLRLGL